MACNQLTKGLSCLYSQTQLANVGTDYQELKQVSLLWKTTKNVCLSCSGYFLGLCQMIFKLTVPAELIWNHETVQCRKKFQTFFCLKRVFFQQISRQLFGRDFKLNRDDSFRFRSDCMRHASSIFAQTYETFKIGFTYFYVLEKIGTVIYMPSHTHLPWCTQWPHLHNFWRKFFVLLMWSVVTSIPKWRRADCIILQVLG